MAFPPAPGVPGASLVVRTRRKQSIPHPHTSPGPCLVTSQTWTGLVWPQLGLCPPGAQVSLPDPAALATSLADLFFQAKVTADEGFSCTIMQHYLSEDPSLPEDPSPLASAWGEGIRRGCGLPQTLQP